ncbi:hypothetical protein ACH3XW_22760 [Acanthocheilonema viteae]|uniref:Uncharacterized protein n=1 Tax=Acanthocheilonema viteae TaxID=6277 RepID=A0A498SR29_ACAVI|nr:unnamed protein product [Acanthocheilonema viteae]
MTTPTKRVVPKTSQPTVPATKRTAAIPTTQPFYSDWTAWSCTESCGGCGIERRTRKCLSIPTSCTEETEEFNDQNCNQHPCPFGKRTCCVNYRLEQMKERFVCIP